MKKILYVCNRCGEEIKTEGTRIIPHFFDLETDEILEKVETPEKDIHFCLSCTKELMEEITRPPEAGGRTRKQKRRILRNIPAPNRRNAWMRGRSWPCTEQGGTIKR